MKKIQPSFKPFYLCGNSLILTASMALHLDWLIGLESFNGLCLSVVKYCLSIGLSRHLSRHHFHQFLGFSMHIQTEEMFEE